MVPKREGFLPGSLSGHPNQPEPFYLVSWQSLEIPSLKIHINDAENPVLPVCSKERERQRS